MQVETFRDQLYAKLKVQNNPLNEKSVILLQSIENNLSPEQKINSTAYLASLVNLLKSTQDGQDAVILLINKVMPLVSVAVVRKLIPIIAEEIVKLRLDSVSIGVIGQILILLAKEDLSTQKSFQLFQLLLQQTISDKKKDRKQAIKTLQSFYQQRGLELNSQFTDVLKEHLKQNLQENNECAQYALTLLASLNNIIPYSVVVDSLYIIIEEIINMDSKYYPFVFLSLEVILLFQQQQVLQQNIGSDQAEKLLQQLNQLQPEEINAQHAYMQCLRQCLISLSQSSISLAASYLPSTLSNLSEFLLQNNQKLMQHCKLEMNILIEKIGKQTLSLKQDLADEIMTLELDNAGSLQQKYIATLTYLFSNRFDHANILEIFAKFFSTIDDSTFETTKDLVQEFVRNKQRWPHVQFEKTFGHLCEGVSLTLLLRTFPLRTEGVNPLDKDFDEKSNCWILYILSRSATPKFDEFLDYLFQFMGLLNLVSNTNPSHEQKIMQNILFHILDIASNSKAGSQNHPKLPQFFDAVLTHLKKENPFYEKLLLMIAKLYSQMVTYPQLQNVAKSYISTLAKHVEQKNCTHTLNAIKVMSFAAPKSYLQEAFKKNIDKLLQSKDALDERSLNNMDIILQVTNAQQMTSDFWEYCMNFCRTMINIPIIQKKIYKFLTLILPKVHSSFFQEVYQLILQSECEPSSRQKRFQVIMILEQTVAKKLEDFQTFIQQFLPEMVVAIRDNNFKTRLLAEKMIQNIGQRLLGLDLLESFISMVFAGLAAQSNVMKADAIATITLMIDKFYPNLKSEFINEITKLIFLLLKEHNNEVYKSIIVYVKSLIKHKFPLNVSMFQQLLNEDEVSRDKNIIILKRLLMKLGRAYPNVESLIPTEHIKLYKNAIKIDKQQKKKKNKKIQEKEQNKLKQQGKQNKQEDDSENEQIEQVVQKGDMETEENENNLLLKFDYKKEQFHFEDAVKQKKKVEQEQKQTQQQIVEYKDGKVIVHEEKQILGLKRRREDAEDEGQATQKKITKNDRKSKEVVHVVKESGDTFKSKSKAGGDVTVRGRPEPFAFIQLNPKALNKRFRNQANKAFEEVLSKKTGALKGIKSHK